MIIMLYLQVLLLVLILLGAYRLVDLMQMMKFLLQIIFPILLFWFLAVVYTMVLTIKIQLFKVLECHHWFRFYARPHWEMMHYMLFLICKILV